MPNWQHRILISLADPGTMSPMGDGLILNTVVMFTNEIRTILAQVYGALNKNKVDCILVGGVAVAFYGYQRISGAGQVMANPEIKHDLDFWYNPVTTNYYNLVAALKDLSIDVRSLEDLVFDPKTAFLRIPHKTFKTEFLPRLTGLPSYQECKQRANSIILDENEMSIISYSDLITNKKSIDREIDRQESKYSKV